MGCPPFGMSRSRMTLRPCRIDPPSAVEPASDDVDKGPQQFLPLLTKSLSLTSSLFLDLHHFFGYSVFVVEGGGKLGFRRSSAVREDDNDEPPLKVLEVCFSLTGKKKQLLVLFFLVVLSFFFSFQILGNWEAPTRSTFAATTIHLKMISVKSLLAESPDLTSIPSSYNFTNNLKDAELHLEDDEVKIPTIDLSLLTSTDPDQRCKVIAELGKACENWGFFMVTNHGVPERLIDAVIDGCMGFFDLAEEEKLEFKGKHVLDPIRYGTSFNPSVDKVFCWRDYLKVLGHPEFRFPNRPSGFSELALEYCKRIREVVKEVLGGISESLGLEADHIHNFLNLESGLQIFVANLYPPCPQPELAMGMPPHSDHGFLTFVIQNGLCGLQIQHNGKWVNVKAIPNSVMVNTCDQLEIFSNGKYKSVLHRAVVNGNATRISVAITNGPSLDTVVSPASELVGSHPSAYIGMKYEDYLELQQSRNLDGKSMLDRVRRL